MSHELNIFIESSRDRESGHVFWFSMLQDKKHPEQILRFNGIHSADKQMMTTTDGGIVDGLCHVLSALNPDIKYSLNIITKRSHASLQKTITSLNSLATNDWKAGSKKYSMEVSDAFALKRLYGYQKRITNINFISDPENTNVKDMDMMAVQFKDLYLKEIKLLKTNNPTASIEL